MFDKGQALVISPSGGGIGVSRYFLVFCGLTFGDQISLAGNLVKKKKKARLSDLGTIINFYR